MDVDHLLLAAPRGYCAGVDRAVETVERALAQYGPPIYVLREIVHNRHVVERLRNRGAIFVAAVQDVPEGARLIFSAHGISPQVRAHAEQRLLQTIDATCPLVTKVHVEARRFVSEGYTVVLIGHEGHEEVEGTMGEAPNSIILIGEPADVDDLQVEDPERIAFITQTTLSVDETARVIARLRERFPSIISASTADICYASTNRQKAVKELADRCDLVLVIGSRNSSNSNRLVDVARDCGIDAHLIEDERDVCAEWLDGKRTVGITSGASAPEDLVQRLIASFADRGVACVEPLDIAAETVRFMLPRQVRPQRTSTTT